MCGACVDRHAGRGGSRRAGWTGRRHGAELESGDRVQGDVVVCIVTRWCAPWREEIGRVMVRRDGSLVCGMAPGLGVRGPGTAVVDQPAGRAAEVSSRPRVSTLINGQPRRRGNPPLGTTTPT